MRPRGRLASGRTDRGGGDTRRERYLFSGGYATENGRWRLGGELKFRAEQEYRTVDPRMRSIVSDLTLRAGAGRTIGHYLTGVSAEGNIYRQTADVDFYGEANIMGELQMTGLGTSYVRFSGSNRDIFYEGKGAGATLDVQPLSGSGWLARFSHALHQYERLSDEYNSLTVERVKKLQKNNGLEETGIADAELQALVFSGNAVKTDTAPKPSSTPKPK